MNRFKKVGLFSFVTMILISFLFTSTPVWADVEDVESQNQRITKTEVTDPKDDPGDNDDSVLDRLTDWGKKLIADIKIKLIDVKDLIVDEWNEFTDWAEDKWKDFKGWSEDAWDDLKEFFSQEWVQTVLKVIGAIVVVAGIILVGAWVLAAVGIALSVGVVVGAIAFGAIGVLLTVIGGDTSFKGMLAGGLSSGIASLAGLGILRALSIFKFLPASGFLRVVTLGLLGGSGAVGFTILHGALHYLFTGDSSLWKEAFTLNSLLFNFTIGGIMGPVATKLFSSVGTQTIKGPGKWVAGILTKYTKKPATKIASSINRGWGAFKASSIYSGLNGVTTTVFDGVTQWKEKGTIDWKKAGKRAAVTIATTMVLVGAGTYFAPKFVIHSCACDDPAITKISQKANVAGDSVAGKGIGKGEQVLDKVKTYEQARNKALDLVGDLGPNSKPYTGTLKSSAGYGKVVGRQSADGKVRWRLDYDPIKGTHINIEDFRNGKGANARKIVVPFEGNESTFKSLLKHLNR